MNVICDMFYYEFRYLSIPGTNLRFLLVLEKRRMLDGYVECVGSGLREVELVQFTSGSAFFFTVFSLAAKHPISK